MTHRERFKTILNGGVPDRMAWVPRLDIWFNANRNLGTLPRQVQGMTLREAEKYLGMAHSARMGFVFKKRYDGIEEEWLRDGDDIIHRFITPKGHLEATLRHSPEAQQSALLPIMTKHYITDAEDYDVMRYVVERTHYEPDYQVYQDYDAEVGEDGFPMVQLGESPIHTIMLHYVGYGNFYYHLADFPEKVHALVEALTESYRELWEVVADSPAEFVLHGVHFHSQMTPPPLFKELFLPYFQEFNDRMHRAGMKIAFHADADLTGLLELVRDCDFDVADTFTCAPLVETTFDQARKVWGDRIVIWGAVPSILLEPSYSFDEFKEYMEDLYAKTANKGGFIMAVADNIMPEAQFDRLEWIRDFLKEKAGQVRSRRS